MKTCRTCGTRYSDNTLLFCLQDGTPLAAAEADTPTVVLGETETRIRDAEGHAAYTDLSEVTRVRSGRRPPSGSRVLIAVAATAVVMFLIFGLAAIGFLYWSSVDPGVSNSSNNGVPNVSRNDEAAVLPSPRRTSSPVPTAGTSTSGTPRLPNVDLSAAQQEVSQSIYGWRSRLEAGDLAGYMSNYASTVDYYRTRGATAARVRADKARAFERYSSMRMTVSNMAISVDPSGEAATAVFDKAWTFSGRGTSSGKVQTELRFRQVGGRWLITSERDLKVYSR